jgi:Family of unknown function (DUF5681)
MKQPSNKKHLFKPGQSGNPLGRPQGARSKFSETAMAHLLDDWTTHGKGVLATVRKEDPSTYLRVAFGTLPKDVAISIENRGPMDSEEGRNVNQAPQVTTVAGDEDPMKPWRGGRIGSQFWGPPGQFKLRERTPRPRLIIQAGNRRLLKQQRLTMPRGLDDET